MMYKLYESEILEEITVCPYCMNDWSDKKDMFGCCGENHPETAFITKNECYLESEVDIILTISEAAE